MSTAGLDKTLILDTAETVIRKYGLKKANIIDVARTLHVSHAAIYRYFDSKTDLWNAVTERWLSRAYGAICPPPQPNVPADRTLYLWLCALVESGQQFAAEDPELFSSYTALAVQDGKPLHRLSDFLIRQLEDILRKGVEEGTFSTLDPSQSARAIYWATSRFHSPVHASGEQPESQPQDFDAVFSLLLRGLRAS